MKDARSRKSLLSFGAVALLAVGAATAQVATTGDTGIDATGSFQSEVQACMSGATQQDRDTCLKEARNASAEKQRGRLELYGAFESNALARCDVHQASDDRAACRSRVMGMGTTDGSIAGGGLIREIETTVTSDQQASAPATQSMGAPQSMDAPQSGAPQSSGTRY
jgi:hypothetical protein